MSPSRHPNWEDELMPYADGELGEEQAKVIAAHLEGCKDCADAVADAKRLSLRMASWQVGESPDKMNDAVLAALAENQLRRESRKSFGWWSRNRIVAYSFAGAAAGLLLFVFIATPSLLRSRQAAPEVSAMVLSKAAPAPPPPQAAKAVQVETLQLDTTGPMVIRTIQLTVITKEFDSARARIEAIVKNAKGYVDQMTVRTNPGSPKGLSASLRFPSDRLDASLAELRKLGIAKKESQSSSDVTSQYVDLNARLTNARNSEQRLQAIVRERTGKIGDVLDAEREISRVRGDIERMEAEKKNLYNQVQYATVHVELEEEYRAEVIPNAPSAGNRLRNAAIQGYQDAKEVVMLIILAILAFGPPMLAVAVILVPIAFLVWRNRRRITA